MYVLYFVLFLLSAPDTHLVDLRTMSGLFLPDKEEFMEKKIHPEAMDIAAQIQNLRNNNLIIEDETEAAHILHRISYYRLIKAYGPFFKDSKNGRYKDNTTFEKLFRVYEFDDHLRHLLIPYLQDIEISFRCIISNHFCVRYGSLGYLNSINFDPNKDYIKLTDDIKRCIFQAANDSPIIKNFQSNYEGGHVPLYAAVEVFTFGTLARFYKTMKSEDRKAIANMFENVDEYYLTSWLVSISYIRNLCFHFNRLYNIQILKKPRLYKKDDGQVDNSTLYSVLCCMRYLCRESGGWLSFVNALGDLLEEYSDCVYPSEIGCISNGWKEKLLDQEPHTCWDPLLSL